ncbi:hypothetical protein HBB16_17520 [Pseudonocardia sp. MCCB 268]|nr:hypothetical protein [Pseudonocardia cytotoxica]
MTRRKREKTAILPSSAASVEIDRGDIDLPQGRDPTREFGTVGSKKSATVDRLVGDASTTAYQP